MASIVARKLKKKSVAANASARTNANDNGDSFVSSPRERMRDICKVLRSLVGGIDVKSVKSVKSVKISCQARPYVGLDSDPPIKFRLKQFTTTTKIAHVVDSIDKEKIDELVAISAMQTAAADRGRFVSFALPSAQSNQSSSKAIETVVIPAQKGGNRPWSTNRANYVINASMGKNKKKSENTRSGSYIASPSGLCKIRVPIRVPKQLPSTTLATLPTSDEKKENKENKFKVPDYNVSFRYVACNPPRQFCTQCQKLNDLDDSNCQHCSVPLAEVMPLRKSKSKSTSVSTLPLTISPQPAVEDIDPPVAIDSPTSSSPEQTMAGSDDGENEDLDGETEEQSELGTIEFSRGLGGGKYTKLTPKADDSAVVDGRVE